LATQFVIDYVALPDRGVPARDFIDSLDDDAAAKVDNLISRLRIFGTEMPGKFVSKLTKDILELRIKHFDRIFRVLFFYQPGRLVVLTSGFQKKSQQTPPAEIARAEHLRRLWLKYRNRYPDSASERSRIAHEEGL
jgi:phage-related protein